MFATSMNDLAFMVVSYLMATQTMNKSALDALPWNDLKHFAKEKGVPVKGTRETLTNDILQNLKENLISGGAPASTKKFVGIAASQKFIAMAKNAPSILNSPPPKAACVSKSTTKKSTRKSSRKKAPLDDATVDEISTVVNTITKDLNTSTRSKSAKKQTPTRSKKSAQKPLSKRKTNIERDEQELDDEMNENQEIQPPSNDDPNPHQEALESPTKRLFDNGYTNAGPSPQIKLPVSRSAFRRGNFTPLTDAEAKKQGKKGTPSARKPPKATSRKAQEEAAAASMVASLSTLKKMPMVLGVAIAAALSGSAFWYMPSSSVPTEAGSTLKSGGWASSEEHAAVSSSTLPTSEVWTRCANPMILQQGDTYVECGVGVYPASHPEHGMLPSVDIEYSLPGMPFTKNIMEIGTFSVQYTVSAPWLKGHKVLTREVIVTDIDECTYDGPNESLYHNCAPSKSCVNTLGSYSCEKI